MRTFRNVAARVLLIAAPVAFLVVDTAGFRSP